ncbi:delta-60 repeat domain-containing protein [Paractinoplanes toevensis]|uniref:Delta-60 repeat domain-containing protein n=1 Tax=Paractinoplanes toevensis TaxID=571911 RepID=A0A919TGD5_9ACTN|nr:delta-60 repeat domain-containing protein [Actinoplanes toevensis]GIM95055.1 hypothetical protein Ato02nite_068480 [Actinoplanes toevensis]
MRPIPHHPARFTMKSPRRPFSVAVLAVAPLVGALVAAAPAQARTFGLDLSFGSGGIVSTDFAEFIDEGRALLVQNDKPVVAGTASRIVAGMGTSDFGVARYTTDGRPDSSFGSGGKVTTDFFGSADDAYAVAGQPDGAVVAAGRAVTADNLDSDFALARYCRDGTLDSAFGSGGKVHTDFGGTVDVGKAMVRQRDGKIVVAGSTALYPVSVDFALARYHVDGRLDTSFGVGGRVVTKFGGASSATALVLQKDGKIVVTGETERDGFDFGLARYNTNGTLDRGFGDGGLVVTDFGGADQPSALLVDAAGRLVAAGRHSTSSVSSTVALARYRPDGRLDRSFGTGGLVTTEMDNATATAVLAQGSKLLVGAAGEALTLARYHSNGTLDRSFGTDGVLATRFGSSGTYLAALAEDSRGRIVAAGSISIEPDYWGEFFAARFR